MKKRILALLLAALMLLGLAACGGNGAQTPADGETATEAPAANGNEGTTADGEMQETPDIIMRLSEDQSPDYPTTMGCQKFADLVYERTRSANFWQPMVVG